MKAQPFVPFFAVLLLLSSAFLQTGMSRRGQYDEEARQAEREAKQMREKEPEERKNPAKNIEG